MKALARALINAAAYLELADEDGVSEEMALQALEEIAYNLSYCNDEEKQIIKEVLDDMRKAELENQTRPAMLEFIETFMASFGLEDGDDEEDYDWTTDINLL